MTRSTQLKKAELLREEGHKIEQKQLTPTFMRCKADAFRATLSSIDTYYSPLPVVHSTSSMAGISTTIAKVKSKKDTSTEVKDSESSVTPFSVFVPSKEQKEASLQSRLQRGKLANSQWELLTKFQTSLLYQENESRKTQTKMTRADQKRALDSQVLAIQEQKHQEELETIEERRRLDCAISREETRRKTELESKRAKAQNNKEAMLASYAEYVANQEQERRSSLETEQKELERIQKQLEQELEAEEERRRQTVAEMEAQRRENDAAIARKLSLEKQKANEDARLVEETLKTLERQDHERMKKLEEFHARIEAKAKTAGKSVIEDAQNRLQQEEERLRRFQEAYDARLEKETREAEEKRRRLQQETVHCLDRQLKDKQDSMWKEQQLAQQYRQEVPVKLHPCRSLHPTLLVQLSIQAERVERDLAREREASRQRKLEYQNELLQQIEDYKSKVLNNEFDMNHTEHLLNKQLIQKAKKPN